MKNRNKKGKEGKDFNHGAYRGAQGYLKKKFIDLHQFDFVLLRAVVGLFVPSLCSSVRSVVKVLFLFLIAVSIQQPA
jgi:hypothetical protein